MLQQKDAEDAQDAADNEVLHDDHHWMSTHACFITFGRALFSLLC